ncbi:hypothetical protein [Polyangium sp. 15x6]|uniref:hypothetical protein n=1 Tax=Polyangium sp. 15x6 TaxID=3042687 RepID=UPI00249BE595|nr:hypothetical protein [Polyangium sp. 15x6]MDI3282909.1 hypothetical protein [Polyangium sp. 15x6]
MRLALHGWLGAASLCVLLLGGCSVSFVDSNNGSGGAGGSGGMGGGQGGGGGCGADSCGQGGGGGSSSSSGGGGMGGGGGSSGAACGGFAGLVCGPDEWCDFPNDRCGDTDLTGICKPRPSGCPDAYFPTCACDGKVYGNPCDAAQAGHDVSDIGNCEPPGEELFSCGHNFCDKATEYCQKTTSDVGGYPDSYQCAPIPAACGSTPNCACLNDPCFQFSCDSLSGGGILVTCPGG